MSNLTIDVRMLKHSGIGTYIQNLIPRIIAAMPEHKFTLLGSPQLLSEVEWSRASNTRIVECVSPIYSLAQQHELPSKIPSDTALFWSPHFDIPVRYSGKILVTVHDCFHLALPRFVGGFHKRLYAKMMFGAVRRKAPVILTPSKFTMNELHRLARIPNDRCVVTPLAVNESWLNIQKSPAPHPKPYLLYVGNVKPHKNLGGLVAAFREIKDKIPHDLVIIGRREGFVTADTELAAQLEGLDTRVHFTGYLEGSVLQQYYANAALLVLPSFYEGFGLTPLEAMACGTPTAVSNAASLPEVCGDATIYFDPNSTVEMAAQILNVLNNEDLRKRLTSAGVERVRQFSWDKCAKQTIAVIESLLN